MIKFTSWFLVLSGALTLPFGASAKTSSKTQAKAQSTTDSAAQPGPDGKKKMSFDSQVVEGEVYRPDYSVVTGEAPGEGWGVLRLRSSFRDHTATDAQEAVH